MPRYVFQEGHSLDFWEVTLSGNSFTTRRGQVGTEGEEKTQRFSNALEAEREYNKLTVLLRLRVLLSEKQWAQEGMPLPELPPEPLPIPGNEAADSARADDELQPAEDAANRYTPDTARQEPEFERLIEKEPDNLEAYLIYGDWLQSQGDLRGELIALQCAAHQAEGEEAERLQQEAWALLRRHKKYLLGPLEDAESEELIVTWRFGFIQSARLAAKDNCYYTGFDFAQAAKQLLALPSARFLRELTFGLVAFTKGNHDNIINTLAQVGSPTLEKLFLGDYEHILGFDFEMELWKTELGNLEPLFKAFPHLRSLKVCGMPLEMGTEVNLPELREFTVERGRLTARAVRSIVQTHYPKLERLEMSFEDRDPYGPTAIGIADLQPLLEGKTAPTLKHLGLHNTSFTDELCQMLHRSPLLKQLETLDLSTGIMTDEGAEAMAANAAAYTHLKHLDVSENLLSAKGDRLVARLCESVARGGQRDDSNGRYRYMVRGR